MEETIYTITLADGTELADLTKNGDSYISSEEISESIFDDNLYEIQVNDGTTTTEYENLELIRFEQKASGECWFALRELSAPELEKLQMQSDIEYVAMMTGVEL